MKDFISLEDKSSIPISVDSNRILIVGASGLIGGCLYHSFREWSWDVDGTYSTKKRKNLLPLDLANPSSSGIDFSKYSHVIIAAGLSKTEQCFLDQKTSRAVNVEGTIEVLRRIKASSSIPIFLSSDYVFEGTTGGYDENGLRKPGTTYGKQKKEVEDFIIQEFDRFLILRLGKVVSARKEDKTFLMEWYEKLKKGLPIRAAQDQVSAILDLQDLPHCLHILIEQKKFGVYHLAAEGELSKLTIARKLCDFFHFPHELIQPCKINELGLKEIRPLNTSLSAKKFVRETNYSFKSVDNVIQRIEKS